MKLEWKTIWKVGAGAFLLYLAIHYWPAINGLLGMLLGAAVPLAIGCIIAYILNILMSAYERCWPGKSGAAAKAKRPICLVGALLTLVAIVALMLGLVLPQLISAIKLIFAELPGFLEKVTDQIHDWGILPEDIMAALESVDWQSRIAQIVQLLTSGIGDVVNVVVSAVSSVFSGIVTAFLSLIFAIYVLSTKERLKGQFHRLMQHYLPDRWMRKIEYVAHIFDDCFHRYIVGQCTEAVILGVLCILGMLILRLPYAPMIGTLVGFTALIPIAGAWIGTAVGIFMILTVSPIKALVFLVFILVLQQLENNLIYPKVVGSSLGLPGIWVLAAVTVGGGVLGVTGMLLGVPLTAAIYRLIREDMAKGKLRDTTPEILPEEPETEE